MHLVRRRNGIANPRHDLRRQLETQIHALGADVEKQVAGRGNRMALTGANLTKGDEGSPGAAAPKSLSQASDPNPMTQVSPPSISRNPTARTNAARSAQKDRMAAAIAGFRVDRYNQEDRGASERRNYRLRNGVHAHAASGALI